MPEGAGDASELTTIACARGRLIAAGVLGGGEDLRQARLVTFSSFDGSHWVESKSSLVGVRVQRIFRAEEGFVAVGTRARVDGTTEIAAFVSRTGEVWRAGPIDGPTEGMVSDADAVDDAVVVVGSQNASAAWVLTGVETGMRMQRLDLTDAHLGPRDLLSGIACRDRTCVVAGSSEPGPAFALTLVLRLS